MKYTEKLAKLLFIALTITVIVLALKYFGTVIGYILTGFVTALVAKPLMNVMRKVKIKGRSAPDSMLAMISISVIFVLLCGIFAGLIPVLTKVASNISYLSGGDSFDSISAYLAGFNALLRETFSLKPDFKIEVLVLNELSSIMSIDLFGNILGSLASTAVSICIALFAVIFIAFFLIKDETLLSRLLSGIMPDRHVQDMKDTISEVEHLLSRYFVGLLLETAIIGIIYFVGLRTILHIDLDSSVGISFLTALLNIIPYIGPVIGCVLGTFMAVAIKYCGPAALCPDMGLWSFVLILLGFFVVARIVDNFILQPVIYSTSIKAHPLEIFIVLLMAATIGGAIGMLIAIPAYTVIRIVAIHFFPESKIVKHLLKKDC